MSGLSPEARAILAAARAARDDEEADRAARRVRRALDARLAVAAVVPSVRWPWRAWDAGRAARIALALAGVGAGFGGGWYARGRHEAARERVEQRAPAAASVARAEAPRAAAVAVAAVAAAASVAETAPAVPEVEAAPPRSESAGHDAGAGASRSAHASHGAVAPQVAGAAASDAADTVPAGALADLPVESAPDAAVAPVNTLAAEMRLLNAARVALRNGDAARALALLDEHVGRFPAAVLREERIVARVDALCALGRTAEARVAAEAFLQDAVRSPYVDHVRASCALRDGR